MVFVNMATPAVEVVAGFAMVHGPLQWAVELVILLLPLSGLGWLGATGSWARTHLESLCSAAQKKAED